MTGPKPTERETPPPETPPKGEQSPPSKPEVTSGTEQEERFEHPLLKGKSPQEIEQLVSTMQSTVREQGARLSRRPDPAKPAAPPAAPAAKKDFFAKPEDSMREIVREEISDLRNELKRGIREASGSPRDKLRGEFSDFDAVEPYIDQLLSQQDYPDPDDAGLLKTLYFTAKGVMVHQGIVPTPRESGDRMEENVHGHEAGKPASAKPSGFAPPQHPASSPPAPPPAASEGEEVQLTENEKRLAKEFGFTPKEYKDWQNLDSADVPTSTIGKPEEGK